MHIDDTYWIFISIIKKTIDKKSLKYTEITDSLGGVQEGVECIIYNISLQYYL